MSQPAGLRGVVGLLVSLLLLASCGDAQVSSVYVVHTNGARTPRGFGDSLCFHPHCSLTENGKQMCRNVGRYIRSQYGSLMPPTNNYSVVTTLSRAQALDRVVVSAEAAVIGMFDTNAIPRVDYSSLDEDTVLSPQTSFQSWVGASYDAPPPYTRWTLSPACKMPQAWISGFLGTEVMSAVTTAMGNLSGTCVQDIVRCVSTVYDQVVCNTSSGNPVPPVLASNLDALGSVVASYRAAVWGYDPVGCGFQSQIGALGYPLAMDIVNHFLNPSPSATIRHAATNLLMPLYSALGIWTPEQSRDPRFAQRFAETVFLEKNMAPNGTIFVRCWWGYPDQQGPNFSFTQATSCGVKCLNKATKQVYLSNASSVGCNLDDFVSFVQSVGPAAGVASGRCYASPAMLTKHNCDTPAAPASAGWCYWYRVMCPDSPCGGVAGAIADPNIGYGCQTLQNDRPIPYFSATIMALVAPALLGGAIAGFYGAGRIRRVLRAIGIPIGTETASSAHVETSLLNEA